MNPSYRKVLIGLKLSSVGLWLVAMSAVLLTSLELYSAARLSRDGVHYFSVVLMVRYTEYGCLGLIAIGLILGFVGRCFCLPVPAAAGTAPARIGLAVIFEACSLLSLAALVGVSFLPLAALPSIVPMTWMGFIWLTAYLARMQFLRFARALAEHVRPSLLPEAVAVQRLYLYVPGGFLLAFGVAAASTLLRSGPGDNLYPTLGVLLGWLIATAATLFGVFMAWRWSELLVGLRKAVAKAAELPVHSEDDPDAEYLARHRAAEAGVSS